MTITHKIEMELDNCKILPPIPVMQSDKYSRNLEITLLSNCQAWAVPDEATVLIRYHKQDGTGGEYDVLPDGACAWAVSGNVVTVAVAPQVCTAAGRVVLAVAILQGEAEINTFVIDFNVHPNPGANITASEDYYKDDSLAGRVAKLEKNAVLPTVTTGDNDKVLKVVDGEWVAVEESPDSGLPEVTTDDNDKILQVVDGAWAVVSVADSAVKTYVDDYINEALGGKY